MRHAIAGVLVVIGALFIAGCATTGAKSDILFEDKYIVGGGFEIEYQAPEPGRAILVDRTSGRMLMTESLQKAGRFESTTDLSDPEISQILSSLGIDLAKAELVLYFIPDSTQPVPGAPE